MNDDMITRDLITTVREPFAGIRMGAPMDAVVGRGQAIRRHRRQVQSPAPWPRRRPRRCWSPSRPSRAAVPPRSS